MSGEGFLVGGLGTIFVLCVGILAMTWIMERRESMCRGVRTAVLSDKRFAYHQNDKRLRRLPSLNVMTWQLWRLDWTDYLAGKFEQPK
jgi:hypothetical protein